MVLQTSLRGLGNSRWFGQYAVDKQKAVVQKNDQDTDNHG
tara:strand:+ start:748 stop:867 length:120 start_codon:yes stop_codon:yes gene_type:complete